MEKIKLVDILIVIAFILLIIGMPLLVISTIANYKINYFCSNVESGKDCYKYCNRFIFKSENCLDKAKEVIDSNKILNEEK